MEQLEGVPFADRYRAILKAYGMTPTDLAKETGQTVSKFYKFGKGVEPRKDVLDAMLRVLPGLSEDYLFSGIGPIKRAAAATVVPMRTQQVIEILNSTGIVEDLRAQIKKRDKLMDEMRAEIKGLRIEVNQWRDAYIRYVEQTTGIDKEGSKMESSSQTTARDSNRRNENDKASLIGYRQEKVDRFAKTGDPIVDILRATPGVISFYERI